MYLKSVKLAGFKSFVDPTTIPIRSNMNAIVGPNGCGKSNVVDAIRWVVGEISAKQLRGQSMADVIFNGTTSRKPLGKAAVELVFDNSDARLGGEWARFGEVAIRREVERDGQSAYFINGTQVRRKDIIDIFLGTGLGPRSYAIIEQGMISQLIEAKPEDLRVFLEEAAGISKYKERRRETENRIRHTQENLDRLSDLREELDKQLRHLKRQSTAAERYQELKKEERELHAQLKALQWQALNIQRVNIDEKVAEIRVEFEKQQAQKRETETEIEKTRALQVEWSDKQNQVQKRFYGLGADIARVEQQIKNTQEQITRWQQELIDANQTWEEITENTAENQDQIQELTAELETLSPQASQLETNAKTKQALLDEAETNMNRWQASWDHYQDEMHSVVQQAEVARTKISHYEHQLEELNVRIAELQSRTSDSEVTALNAEIAPLALQVNNLDSQIQTVAEQLETTRTDIKSQRETNQGLNNELQNARTEVQSNTAKQASLEALQNSALQGDAATSEWLQKESLQNNPRLGKELQVAPGWELAVETVLGGYFDALCVDDISVWLDKISHLEQGRVTLLAKNQTANTSVGKAPTLASKITSAWPLAEWLTGVYIAEDVTAAQALVPQLGAGESVITSNGLWLGSNWARIAKVQDDPSKGVLVREQEIQRLNQIIAEQQTKLQIAQARFAEGEARLISLEKQREEQHANYQRLSSQLSDVRAQFSAKESRLQEWQDQQQRLRNERAACEQKLAELKAILAQAQEDLEEYTQAQYTLVQRKETLLIERDSTRMALDEARVAAQQATQRRDELGIRLSANESQLALLKQTMARDERQLSQLTSRREHLQHQLADTNGPLQIHNEELQKLLDARVSIEQELHAVEDELNVHNQQFEQHEKNLRRLSNLLGDIKESIQAQEMERQAITVRQTTIEEQLAETDLQLQAVVEGMPQEANVSEWEVRVEKVATRISRLGPINLAAIEEYQTTNERKEYLDKQNADLVEALDVLRSAISKIDKETRSKFKETFDNVNNDFQMIFPKIFGGGRAILELSEDDLLTAGIIVKAQPPGKRNATIHMLSGGEKALTAISLVFALFKLNPAPFCILDEVDAPLDDLNVGRFCQLVKAMSTNTQFLVISHNKVTIEMADHLMGVTMQEAGVSRIVSVDMQEAIDLVEA